MVKYEGIFFDKEESELIHSLERNKLENINDIIHCTFKYMPNNNEIFNELVGREIEVTLIGYGSDDKNSGFSIKLPDDINEYYINYDEDGNLRVPHITASLALEADAKDTKNLNFEKMPFQYKIKGKFGFWIKEDDKEYLSFEQYKINNTIENNR